MMVACWTGITLELHPCVPIHNASLAAIPTEIFHDIPNRYMFIYTYVSMYNIYIYIYIYVFHWQCMCSNKSKEVIHSLTCLVYIPLNLPTWTSRRSCAWCARRSQRTPRRCIRSLYLPTPGVRWGPQGRGNLVLSWSDELDCLCIDVWKCMEMLHRCCGSWFVELGALFWCFVQLKSIGISGGIDQYPCKVICWRMFWMLGNCGIQFFQPGEKK